MESESWVHMCLYGIKILGTHVFLWSDLFGCIMFGLPIVTAVNSINYKLADCFSFSRSTLQTAKFSVELIG